jgi:hypothetical protein
MSDDAKKLEEIRSLLPKMSTSGGVIALVFLAALAVLFANVSSITAHIVASVVLMLVGISLIFVNKARKGDSRNG